jgi:hypothetical protein
VGNVTPAVRIAIIVLAALAVVGLVAYARGHTHHRGWEQIGRHGMSVVSAAGPDHG